MLIAIYLHLRIYQMLLSKATYTAFRLYVFFFISMCVEPTSFSSTTEPQEHLTLFNELNFNLIGVMKWKLLSLSS